MNVKTYIFLFSILPFLVIVTEVDGYFEKNEAEHDEGVLGRIKTGLKMAGNFLGLDAASGVASLVAEAFSKKSSPPRGNTGQQEYKEQSWGATLLSGIMRALSLDTAKISAVVLNAIVFLAQLITTSIAPKNLALPESRRKVRDGSPIDWILDNPTAPIQSIIETAQATSLPDKIIESLKENSQGIDISCVQLLICKTAPFIWGMQRAVADLNAKYENGTKSEENRRGSNIGEAFFRHLPEVSEFLEHGDSCEEKYEECRLID